MKKTFIQKKKHSFKELRGRIVGLLGLFVKGNLVREYGIENKTCSHSFPPPTSSALHYVIWAKEKNPYFSKLVVLCDEFSRPGAKAAARAALDLWQVQFGTMSFE